jgi:hypothetical protein
MKDAFKISDNPKYFITMAVPMSNWYLRHFDL